MSAVLEWREPTEDEYAEWTWVYCRNDHEMRMDLLRFARAVQFERRVRHHYEEAEDALQLLDASDANWSEQTAARDQLFALLDEAEQRVNELAAKVLGWEVRYG